MKLEIKCFKRGEKDFPPNLYELTDCPDKLYVLGNEKLLNEFSIAVIGARKCTLDGKRIAEQISADLAGNGVHIVSGLAYGIDCVAHQASLGQKGNAIGVLAYGIEYLYQNCRESLYQDIIDSGGVIVSEYPPDTLPNKGRFHNRNRIIAALSSGIIVVEARDKSGSLITVDYGKKLEKDIFVVPGGVLDENYVR
ncbi:MAG: DNA-processing protein DprA [Clostridia bacterium]|nr:DNA-processing protein DprA [Clostridia bacterium]